MSVGLGVVLGVLGAQVSQRLVRQRGGTCDGMLPMPTSAYLLAWAAVALCLLGGFLVLRAKRTPALTILLIIALAFTAFVVYSVYSDAPTHRFLCSG
ncbi:hypothetical protein [Actinokineospora enzanensis]|uniref:hypothetical protein n=1 Tax=Actinokineospora enzanensis TaxID=155975 RepID=UPI0003A1BEC7|nr:hypothetical protein [Actinokineospora enzanensis]